MSFESDVCKNNSDYFFKEFTYAKNMYCKSVGGNKQAGDCIIYIDSILYLIEMKERDPSYQTKQEKNEENWFNNKVIKKAKTQLKKTVKELKNGSIRLINMQNDNIDITLQQTNNRNMTLYKVVLYLDNEYVPRICKLQKFEVSNDIGLIHLFSASTWEVMISTLVTPIEISEYLHFRETLYNLHTEEINKVEEISLIGQYLSGKHTEIPTSNFTQYYTKLKLDKSSWDLSWFLQNFSSKIFYNSTENKKDYYLIFNEIAKLRQFELHIFCERFRMLFELAQEKKSHKPLRFKSLLNDCAFIFVPTTSKDMIKIQEDLHIFLDLCKYEMKCKKCIAISVIYSEPYFYTMSRYIDHPWEEDVALEKQMNGYLEYVGQAKRVELPRFDFTE